MIPNYKLFKGDQPQFQNVIDTSRYTFRLYYDSYLNKTKVYPEMVCAVRRDSIVWLNFISKSGTIDSTNFFLNVHATFDSLNNSGLKDSGFSFQIRHSTSKSVLAVLELSSDAPVGFYNVQLINGSTPVSGKLSIFVVFNPLSPNDLVHVENRTDIDCHILREKMVIFVGNSKDVKPKTYKLSQFSIEAILTAIFYSNRMDVESRRDPELFARLFSPFLNNFVNKGLIAGNWTKDFSEGVSPSSWKNNADIFRKFLETGEFVKYGQCYNFASCYDSLSRLFGMFSYAISMFPCGHDQDGDGIITKYYSFDKKYFRNFHCANNILFKRNTQIYLPTEASKYLLQHIDTTPQSISDDGYSRCGPQPIELVKTQAYLHTLDVPYDAKEIYESVNGKFQKVFLKEEGEIDKTLDCGQCCKYIYTCGRDFEKVDLMTHYRKLSDISPPPPMTTILYKFDAPSKAFITDSINFRFSISNTSEGFPTFMSLTAHLLDDIGHLILDDPLVEIYRVFNQKSLSIQSVLDIQKIEFGINLLEAQIIWDFQIFDDKLNDIQSTEHFTSILPCISGKINDVSRVNDHEAKISVTFKNELNFPLSNCRLILEEVRIGGSIKVKNYVSCLPDSLIHHQYKLKLTEYGLVKIKISIHCPYGRYVLDDRRILHGKYFTALQEY